MAEGFSRDVPVFQRFPRAIRSLSLDENESRLESENGKYIVQNLGKIRRDDEFTDITLKIGQTQIKAHRVVLAAFSPYFRALLGRNMREGGQNIVELHDLNGPVLEKLIEFAYSGRLVYAHDTVQEILETANFLDVSVVRHNCAKYIARQLDSQNFGDVYTLGRQIGEEIMINSAVSYCLDNFTMISKSQEFLSMSAELLEDALKAETLQFYDPEIVPIPANQEAELLRVVLCYVSHDRAARLSLLPNLLTNLRLPTLLPSFLLSLKEHAVISESQECLVLIERALEQQRSLRASPEAATRNLDTWIKPRDNSCLMLSWSQVFAGGREIHHILECYDDSERISSHAYLVGMKIWSRRWDGRQIWGGYEAVFSDGSRISHGATDLQYEVYEFRLEEGEVVLSLDINSGWGIDQVTFHTSRGRSLGPYGGDGGGLRAAKHHGRDEKGGFLVCTKGKVAYSQNEQLITCLQFQWKSWKLVDREGRNRTNSDSGEDMDDPMYEIPAVEADFVEELEDYSDNDM